MEKHGWRVHVVERRADEGRLDSSLAKEYCHWQSYLAANNDELLLELGGCSGIRIQEPKSGVQASAIRNLCLKLYVKRYAHE